MSRDLTEQELQELSDEMVKAGYMSYEEFSARFFTADDQKGAQENDS